jgi:hypothetical protein
LLRCAALGNVGAHRIAASFAFAKSRPRPLSSVVSVEGPFMKSILIAALVAAFVSGAAPAEAEAEQVCVLVPRPYEASIEDIRRLKVNPIPDSFRAAMRGEGACGNAVLLEETLLSLHRRYGDEKSTAAALAFLALAAREGLAETRDELRAAAAARAGALAALRKAEDAALAAPGDAKASAAFDAALSALPRPSQATYDFLAALFLKAGEFYRSPRFLKNARFYRRAGDDAARIEANAAPKTLPSAEDVRLARALAAREALDRRIGVLEARFSRKAADIAHAHAAVLQSYDSDYASEAEHADLSMQSLCGSGIECKDGQAFQRAARAFWSELAVVEMLMAADPKHFHLQAEGEAGEESPSRFVKRTGGGPSDLVGATTRARRYHANLARRALLRPDLYPQERFFEAAEEHGLLLLDADALLPSSGQAGAYYAPGDRIAELGEALKLIAPYEHPALWRRLGERFLAISDIYAQEANLTRLPDEEALYRYVRTTLLALERGPFSE